MNVFRHSLVDSATRAVQTLAKTPKGDFQIEVVCSILSDLGKIAKKVRMPKEQQFLIGTDMAQVFANYDALAEHKTNGQTSDFRIARYNLSNASYGDEPALRIILDLLEERGTKLKKLEKTLEENDRTNKLGKRLEKDVQVLQAVITEISNLANSFLEAPEERALVREKLEKCGITVSNWEN